MGRVAAGPTISPSTSREPLAVGAGFVATSGFGYTSADELRTTGVETSLRANFTGRSQNVAFGSGVYFTRAFGARGAVFVDGGLHLSFERYDDSLLVGVGPYAAIGLAVAVAQQERTTRGFFSNDVHVARTLVTFGPSMELDARFTRPSSIPFFGFQIGVMWSDENKGPQKNEVPAPDLPPLTPSQPDELPAPPTAPTPPTHHPRPPPTPPPRPGDIQI